jgi:uncharacterized cupin superfamily protein
MQKPIAAEQLEAESAGGYPTPFAQRMGQARWRAVGNHSAAVAQFIVMGTRVPGDNAFYPDDDLAWLATEQGKVAVHKDGRPYLD